MEYRLDDPDCAVARTVRIQGYDTRNLLGRGRFEGTLQVSGIDTGAFQTAHAAFPVSPGTANVWYAEPNGYRAPQEIFSLSAERDWSAVALLLLDGPPEDGGGWTGLVLVSGPPDREAALALAERLAALPPVP